MTHHPLDPFGPKPGTPEYEKNFDDWYSDRYGPPAGIGWVFLAGAVGIAALFIAHLAGWLR